MNIRNKKINNFSFSKISSNRGIALLFSIMLATIFLTIAIGVLNISVKELNFSASTKDTNNAFFAADTGIECALYNDKSSIDFFRKEWTTQRPKGIDCFGDTINFTGGYPSFNFSIDGLGSNSNSCVKILVEKIEKDAGLVATRITSKGYNFGAGENCTSSVLNRVERVLELNYDNSNSIILPP